LGRPGAPGETPLGDAATNASVAEELSWGGIHA
jgi:hypothetical protein